MENLVIDIGNSSLKAAFADGCELKDIHRIEEKGSMTDTIVGLMENREISVIAISCVGEVEKGFFRELESRCNKLIVVTGDTPLQLINEYKNPEALGSDRFVAGYAANILFPDKDCMIFDFGTAITIDFITADGKFSGGNISPGLKSRFRSLNDYTQKLPLVETPLLIPEKGRETIEAIQAGVILGLIFEIEGYMRMYPGYTTIFTGGDANFFAGKTKNPIFVVCNLVLKGLAHIANSYDENR